MRALALMLLTTPALAHVREEGNPDEYAMERIEATVRGMRSEGFPEESVARAAHKLRRELRINSLASPQRRAASAHQNTLLYGDPYGPSIDYLLRHGKSWREISNTEEAWWLGVFR